MLDGHSSKTASVLSGVPQGTFLWPTLFFNFIDDLPSCVDYVLRLFAEDSNLYREIRSMHDAAIMYQDLDAHNRW